MLAVSASVQACYVIFKAAKEVQQAEIQQLAYEHLASNIGRYEWGCGQHASGVP